MLVLLAFIVMCFILLPRMAFVHILVILFSFSSVYQNVSSSSMQHSFFIHIVSVLRKICAMDLIFLLSRDDHAFFMQPVTTLLFILCAHNVLCSAFIQQRGIHLQFIFPFHHFLYLLQFFFATFFNGHVMLLIASNACIHTTMALCIYSIAHQKLTIETVFTHTLRAETSTASADSLYLSVRIVYKWKMLKKKYETFSFKHSIWVPTAREVKENRISKISLCSWK